MSYFLSHSHLPLFSSPRLPKVFLGDLENTACADWADDNSDLEKVLLPGEIIQIKDSIKTRKDENRWVAITKSPYPLYGKKELFTLRALIKPAQNSTRTNTPTTLPSRHKFVSRLREFEHTPYLYGGGSPEGISEFHETIKRYENATIISKQSVIRDIQKLRGVDCSGLFSLATDGYAYPDSKDMQQLTLKHGGRLLDIDRKDISEILSMVQPGDILYMHRHVMFFMDKNTIIQAVGRTGENAQAFTQVTGKTYGKVVIDDAKRILEALISIRKILPANSYTNEHQFCISRIFKT